MDYVLYMAEAYTHVHSINRADRVQDILTALGITINAGFYAKLGTGFNLFYCILPMFK
jgi:hypothetical protein